MMCHKSKFCTELDEDSRKWSKQCPLPLPSYFHEAVERFSLAVSELAKGNIQKSLEILETCDSVAVGRFYIEHGQQTSYSRVANRQEIDNFNFLNKKINPSRRNTTTKMTKEVFERDFYRCRYCSLPIITAKVFSEYSRIVGSDSFPNRRANTKRNGLTLGLRGVADHVRPHSLDGRTELDNLVTSCYSCNFGKAEYTLKQIGIEDPRLKQPKDDGWRGLTEFLPMLKAIKT